MEIISLELVSGYIPATQAIPLGLLCGQYDVPMILKYNYFVQHACNDMKVVWQLSNSFTPET